MAIVVALLALAAIAASVLVARALARQQRRLERIGRRVSHLELDAGPTVIMESAGFDDTQPRLPTQLPN